MSAAKAGTYVLAASAFYRVEGEGDERVRRRYKRGDKIELSKAEAARLTASSRLAGPSFVKAGTDVEPGHDLATAPDGAVNRESEANQLQAEANTGLNESTVIPTTDGAPEGPPTGDGPPAKSALLDAWQAYAVKVGAVTEEESGAMTKAALQEAVARKVGG